MLSCQQLHLTSDVVNLLLAHHHQVGLVSVDDQLVALHVVGDGLVLGGESAGEYHRVLTIYDVSSILYKVHKTSKR